MTGRARQTLAEPRDGSGGATGQPGGQVRVRTRGGARMVQNVWNGRRGRNEAMSSALHRGLPLLLQTMQCWSSRMLRGDVDCWCCDVSASGRASLVARALLRLTGFVCFCSAQTPHFHHNPAHHPDQLHTPKLPLVPPLRNQPISSCAHPSPAMSQDKDHLFSAFKRPREVCSPPCQYHPAIFVFTYSPTTDYRSNR